MSDWKMNFKRLEGAYAPSTMRGYYGDIQIFVDWCEEQGVTPFPAKVDAVCSFLDNQAAAGLAISSIRRRIYALRKAHNLLRHPDPTRDEDVNLTFRRIRRASFARPAQAKGLTKDFLQQFLDAQPNNPWGLRNQTMLSLGYDLLTRRGELVALKDRDLEPCRDGTYRCVIRRSKADPFGNGRTAFCSRRSTALIDRWRTWRGPDIEWLFCPIYSGKAINRSLSSTVSGVPITRLRRSSRGAGLGSGSVCGL